MYPGVRATLAGAAAPFHGASRLVHPSALHDNLQHHSAGALDEGTILERAQIEGIGNCNVRLVDAARRSLGML
eukprot:6539392-Alexandrium_andersonii.AAC.1